MKSTIHPFERAGLGKAPFRYIGCTEKRGPIKSQVAGGVTVEIGAPGQPMGTCDYCGQGIAVCCSIKSADGRVFTVGNVCVNKAHKEYGDTDLASAVRRDMRKRQVEREDARVKAAFDKLDAEPAIAEALDGMKSPRGGSALDWVNFCRTNAGHSGRVRAARMIEKAAKAAGDNPADAGRGTMARSKRQAAHYGPRPATDDAWIAWAFRKLDGNARLREALAAKPAPAGRGNALDWANFCRANAGRRGKLRVVELVGATLDTFGTGE